MPMRVTSKCKCVSMHLTCSISTESPWWAVRYVIGVTCSSPVFRRLKENSCLLQVSSLMTLMVLRSSWKSPSKAGSRYTLQRCIAFTALDGFPLTHGDSCPYLAVRASAREHGVCASVSFWSFLSVTFGNWLWDLHSMCVDVLCCQRNVACCDIVSGLDVDEACYYTSTCRTVGRRQPCYRWSSAYRRQLRRLF